LPDIGRHYTFDNGAMRNDRGAPVA
jgi:hypothetical protein